MRVLVVFATLPALRASGIAVEPFRRLRLSTLHLTQNRSHVRGIVIDSHESPSSRRSLK